MPPLPRPWTERILALIDAGVTERSEIIRRTVAFVPQGHAYRMRETTNQRLRERRAINGHTPVARESCHSASELHRIGATAVIGRTINSLVRHGTLVRIGDEYRRP